MLASSATASPSLDHRGRGARDRALALDLEPQAEVEADLRLPVLQRPDAAADAGDEALACELGEVAAHRDLGNRKRFRKFRNVNGVARLEHLQHLLHALVLARDSRKIDAARRCGRPYAS